MAKYERDFTGDFDSVINTLHNAVIDGSASASYEDGSDIIVGDTRVAVRVYERYSWTGSNRVSMALTLVGVGNRLLLSAITSGGSEALVWKINTIGEEYFLDTIAPIAESL